MDPRGSVTQWIVALEAGDSDAAQQKIWNRYFRRLVGLARWKLGNSPRRAEDEEDVALGALCSFFTGMQAGEFPQLRDRDNLWPLLAKIAVRKAINQRERQLAEKRGGGRVRGDSVRGDLQAGGKRNPVEFVDDEVTPDTLVAIEDQCQRLLDILPDDQIRQIVRLKLQGHTNSEVAAQLGVVERTVERKLSLIRSYWMQAAE
jgi:DNA-directed RNA polymerase specialized sigma24 family protein